MMSLPFLLFACGLGAAWLRQRGAAMGFWVAGLVVLLVLFRVHMAPVRQFLYRETDYWRTPLLLG